MPAGKPSTSDLLNFPSPVSQSESDGWINILEHIPGGYFIQRIDLTFTEVCSGAESYFGRSVDEFSNRRDAFLSCLHEDDRVAFLNHLKAGLQNSGPLKTTYRVVHPETHAVSYLQDIRVPFTDAEGQRAYRGIWVDLTRQIVAEKRLTFRAWRETASSVTSGLVHDFANVMAGIFSISELYHSTMDEEHSMFAGITQIKKSSFEAQKLVRRIIELNREVSGEKNYFNLESLIREQLDFLKAVLPRGTRIESHFNNVELPVYLDEVSFRQVLLNLATNARDAMDKDGCITIRVIHHQNGGEAPADILPADFSPVPNSAEIIFADNGCGVPPAVASRIFDPFFSTKEAHKGSGLGLYNARLFVTAHHGQLGVVTKPGQGTEFHLLLPLVVDEQPADPSEPADENTADRRHHVLTYCWEDISQFDLIDEMRRQTWEILNVVRIEKALDYLNQSVFPIDVVIIFRIGLDENADRLLETLKSQYPEIKVALLIVGEPLDQVPRSIRDRADTVIHQNLKLTTMLKRLSLLLK